MEFRIAAEELVKALHRAHGIAERKTTIPILANVLLQARKGTVSLTAFDLDIGLVSEHPAEVVQEGAITLSCKILFDIVRDLPEATASFKRTGPTSVEITCGSAQYTLMGMPAEEYPVLPKEEKSNLSRFDGGKLLEMIYKTAFAISNDDTRYILNGLFFEADEKGMVRAVATDGHRLSLVERFMEGADFKLKRGVIVPRKGLLELRRLLEEAPSAECFLGFGDTSAIFKKTGLTMFMRLLDGQFPDYKEVIPKEGERQVELPRQQLQATLKRISLLSEEKSHSVRLTFGPDSLRVSSQNPDLGHAKEDLPIKYQGPRIEVAFNARYLNEALSAMEGDLVSCEVADEQSPGVLRPVGDKGMTVVVMPMRI